MLQTMSEKKVKEWVEELLILLHEYVLERDKCLVSGQMDAEQSENAIRDR
jgi:hypothetical protein